jgi:hypothetical protein
MKDTHNLGIPEWVDGLVVMGLQHDTRVSCAIHRVLVMLEIIAGVVNPAMLVHVHASFYNVQFGTLAG